MGGVFGGGQNLPGDFFRYVSFAAVVAHFCGDGLEDERGAFPLDCDARMAGPVFPILQTTHFMAFSSCNQLPKVRGLARTR